MEAFHEQQLNFIAFEVNSAIRRVQARDHSGPIGLDDEAREQLRQLFERYDERLAAPSSNGRESDGGTGRLVKFLNGTLQTRDLGEAYSNAHRLRRVIFLDANYGDPNFHPDVLLAERLRIALGKRLLTAYEIGELTEVVIDGDPKRKLEQAELALGGGEQ